MYLKLNRKGHIDTTLSSDNQCKDIGWKNYRYQVAIICQDDNTDVNEFIIDNTVVHRTIIDCFNNHMTSCEGMVKRVAACLLETAKEHGVDVLDLHLLIAPRGVDEHSYAWFEWSLTGNF